MDPTQERPLQPSGPAPTPSSSPDPKVRIEPGRMQAIQEAFDAYKNVSSDLKKYEYKITVNSQLDQTALKALSDRIGVAHAEDGWGLITSLVEKGVIRDDVDELHTFIENNLKEIKPDEAVQPSSSDLKTKAQRRDAIQAAYQEYMDVDAANPENKVAAFITFVDKLNKQMTVQEVKSIALAYKAPAEISDFKGFIAWLESQPETIGETVRVMLDGKDPASVKRMMDTIFPSTRLL